VDEGVLPLGGPVALLSHGLDQFLARHRLAGLGQDLGGGVERAQLLVVSRTPFLHGSIVAGILALGAGISLIATIGKGAIWSQVTALTAMAPAAALGGYLRDRTLRPKKAPGDIIDS
jgi:hypothetical protein